MNRFNGKKIGASVVCMVARRDQLRNISVTVGKDEPVTYSVKEKLNATEMEQTIFKLWLGERPK